MSTHQIMPKTNVVDAVKMGIKPGDVVMIPEGYTTPLRFVGIQGTEKDPVTIIGGSVTVAPTLSYGVKFESCKYFKFLGTKISGGNISVTVEKLSTNFEIGYLDVSGSGFAGIMAKSDPVTDDAVRGKFTMRDCMIHDNFVHDIAGGEGLYIGNSFYKDGVNTDGVLRFPHEIENLKIFRNLTVRTAREGIQVGCGVRGVEIYDNSVQDYGTEGKAGQNSGIQIGEGTGGKCYGNRIRNGSGNGLIVLGLGDNVIYGNEIVNAGEHGVFVDDRINNGPGFQFIDNDVQSPKMDGFRVYSLKFPVKLINNSVSKPGGQHLKTLNSQVNIVESGSVFI